MGGRILTMIPTGESKPRIYQGLCGPMLIEDAANFPCNLEFEFICFGKDYGHCCNDAIFRFWVQSDIDCVYVGELNCNNMITNSDGNYAGCDDSMMDPPLKYTLALGGTLNYECPKFRLLIGCACPSDDVGRRTHPFGSWGNCHQGIFLVKVITPHRVVYMTPYVTEDLGDPCGWANANDTYGASYWWHFEGPCCDCINWTWDPVTQTPWIGPPEPSTSAVTKATPQLTEELLRAAPKASGRTHDEFARRLAAKAPIALSKDLLMSLGFSEQRAEHIMLATRHAGIVQAPVNGFPLLPAQSDLEDHFDAVMQSWAAAGHKPVDRTMFDFRSKICAACEHWVPGAYNGVGACRKGGAPGNRWLVTETCPLDKW